MSSELSNKIIEDMKTAMREQDKARLATIRLAIAAMKQVEVDERKNLTDDDVLQILNKMIKQRRDSVQQYEAARRDDLAANEKSEIAILQAYMPEQLSEAVLGQLIDQALGQVSETGMAAMGKVMGILKPKIQGRADMGAVSAMVRKRLN